MCFGSQGECEEDRTKLQLHCEETYHGLQQESMEKLTNIAMTRDEKTVFENISTIQNQPSKI